MNSTTLESPASRPTLSELDEEQRYAAYDRLQQAMPDVWAAMRQDHPDESVIVVPSISLERSSGSRAQEGQRSRWARRFSKVRGSSIRTQRQPAVYESTSGPLAPHLSQRRRVAICPKVIHEPSSFMGGG